jgi:hypothetical protein
LTVTSIPNEAWNRYGADFLVDLDEQRDWRSVEALWRFGGPADLTDLAKIMAGSGNARLASVLVKALLSGRYSDKVPALPELLLEHCSAVTATTARGVLDRLGDAEKPLKPPYSEKVHVVVAWLLAQPGPALDELAFEIITGGHQYADLTEPRNAAIARAARSPEVGARTVGHLAADPGLWATGTSWVRTADVVARLGNPRGRAGLVRAMTAALMELPPEEPIQLPAEFALLMEKHAGTELREAFAGEELSNTPGTAAAARAVAVFKPTTNRDDLVEVLARNQPVLWSAYRGEIYANWSVEDWDRMLRRWSLPASELLDAGEVLDEAPSNLNPLRIRAIQNHGAEPGDYAARVAISALTTIAAREDEEEFDAVTVAGALPWDLAISDGELDYLGSILQGALGGPEHSAVVLHAFCTGDLTPDAAVALLPAEECLAAFSILESGAARGSIAAALYERCEVEFVEGIIRQVVDADNNTFDVVAAIAPHDAVLAFESFNDSRWHDLSDAEKDVLTDLLEKHATLEQEPLLDAIANDSDGPNAPRRARAAKRWAALAPIHSVIPPGILSLLESNREMLIQTFAEVAASVQPQDDATLVSLQDKWLNGGKTGASARAALDNTAAGLTAKLKGVRAPDRREQCPPMLHILGITAAPETFDTLLSYVGDDAVDDNVTLRRAAAAAVRAFVDVTRLRDDQLTALGQRLSTETDPTATDDLRNALAAADLGDDAAVLSLYALADLNPHQVSATPDELFGSEKARLLTALKKMRVQQALGEPGWDGFVEQMDLVGEALVRTAYLRYGPSDALKKEIRGGVHNKPEYGNLVKAIAQASGFNPVSAHLQTVHDIRSTRTAAHHPSGGDLDDPAVTQAENALRTAARMILDRLLNDNQVLRAVPPPAAAAEDAS